MRIVIQARRHKVWATKKRDWAAYQISQVYQAVAMNRALWEQSQHDPHAHDEGRADA